MCKLIFMLIEEILIDYGWLQIMVGKQKKNKFISNDVVAKAITVYVFIVVVSYVLYLIAPVLTFISSTPLYSFQTYLGLVGGLLIIIDFLTTRYIFKSKLWYLLVFVCIIAALSMLKMRQYGLKDNFFSLTLVTIQLTLVYSFSTSLNKRQLHLFAIWLYRVVALIWLAACSASIIQFIFQIGYRYVADPNTENPELTRQGFLQNRLFGLFTGLDYAVYISWFLIIVSIYFFIISSRRYQKIIIFCSSLVFFTHIILSGSRSVFISILLCSFFITFFLMRNFEYESGKVKIVKRVLIPFLVVISVLFIYWIGKIFWGNVPIYFNNDKQPEVREFQNEQIEKDFQVENKETQEYENILERKESRLSSNNRDKIWASYLDLYKEYGLLGLSLSNYNDYISDKHQDSYLVTYFSNLNEGSKKPDLVYESHNNYIFVFVAVGYLGAICFFTFLFFSMKDILKNLFLKEDIPQFYIFCVAIIGSGCIQAMFMNGVFLKINAVSYIFWMVLGIVNNKDFLIN